MSTDRVKGKIVFTCDECEDHLDTDETDFHDARVRLKEERWQYLKDEDGKWKHLCTSCANSLPGVR